MIAEQTELRGYQNQSVVVTGPQGVQDLLFPQRDGSSFRDDREVQLLLKELKPTFLLRAISTHTGQYLRLTGDQKQEIPLPAYAPEALRSTGGLLLDLTALKPHVVMPGNGDEIQNFARNAIDAAVTGEPLEFFTPCCPDWSQNSDGQYDYQALNGGPSFIAEKFFQESPQVLAAFQRNGIPYRGTLIIADWGLENEIEAFSHDGRPLSPNEVAERFCSTAAHAEESLARLQADESTASLYADFRIVLMTGFFQERGFNADATYQDARELFLTNSRGQKLVRELHSASMPINSARRGLTEEQNLAQAIQSVSEYATFSAALPDNSMLFAAESQTTSKAYNTHRQAKVPLLFLNGRSESARAVNIL